MSRSSSHKETYGATSSRDDKISVRAKRSRSLVSSRSTNASRTTKSSASATSHSQHDGSFDGEVDAKYGTDLGLPDDVANYISNQSKARSISSTHLTPMRPLQQSPFVNESDLQEGDAFIKRFDLSCVQPGSVIVTVGKRKSGKTYLLRDILYQRRHAHEVVLFAGSTGTMNDMGDIIPDLFIHFGFIPSVLLEIIVRFTRINKKRKDQGKPMRECILVIEDLGFSDANVFDDLYLRYIINNGRHIGITVMISLQYIISIPTKVRFQIDYLFMFRSNAKDNIEKFYKIIGGVFPNLNVFMKYFYACTPEHTCMVAKNVDVSSSEIEDNVFYYKADDHPPGSFKVGSRKLWAYNSMHLDPNKELDVVQIIERSASAKKRKELEAKRGARSSSSRATKNRAPDNIFLVK